MRARRPRAGGRPRTADHRRGKHLQRVLSVIRELRASRWELKELAAHMGIAWRSVYRDVIEIERAGIQVTRSGESPGRVEYRIARDELRKVLGV